MALTDGEEAPAKYVFADSFDKKSLNGVFSDSRVLLAYVKDGDNRKLLGLKKEPPLLRGMVTGAVVFIGDDAFWIAVKPANGPPDGYALGTWPPGEMGVKLKALNKGDVVAIRFHTDGERHRIDTLDVVSLAPAFTVDKDIEYGKVDGTSLKLDFYRPNNRPKGPMPLILWFHGGGWSDGGKQALAMSKPEQFVQRGYCFASIDYRLSVVAKFPAALEDCKCAVRWARKNAQTYGLDPDRIGVMGYSAGGHLALMVGCTPNKPEWEGKGGNEGVSSGVQAVCSFSGPTDLREFKKGGQGETAVKTLCGGTAAEKPDVYEQASPVTHAAKDNPPILMIHGEVDQLVPIAQAESMAAKLKDAGAKVDFIRIRNYSHDKAVGKQDPSPQDVQKSILDFFDAALKAPRQPQ
jgi:acetyl esterase/lipase